MTSSPLKRSIRAACLCGARRQAAGPCGRTTALRSLAESLDSTRLRALPSATMTRPRLQSDFINGQLGGYHLTIYGCLSKPVLLYCPNFSSTFIALLPHLPPAMNSFPGAFIPQASAERFRGRVSSPGRQARLRRIRETFGRFMQSNRTDGHTGGRTVFNWQESGYA